MGNDSAGDSAFPYRGLSPLIKQPVAYLQNLRYDCVVDLTPAIPLSACVEPVHSWWSTHHPPIGTFIALLALIGVLIPWFRVQDKIKHLERVVWILLMCALAIFEIRTLYSDRREHDEDDAYRTCIDLNRYKEVTNRVQTAIDNGRNQFQATMRQEKGILSLTKENVENMIGVGTFPYIVPQTFAGVTEAIPLYMWAHGNHLLNGVTYTIRKFEESGLVKYPPVDVGVLHPGWGRELKTTITPKPGKDGTDGYMIDIYTQSGSFQESLGFRRSTRGNVPWAYRYMVSESMLQDAAARYIKTQKLKINFQNVDPNISVPRLVTKGWSDEPGFGLDAQPLKKSSKR